MPTKNIMVVCGTRPEAIKMGPLVNRLRGDKSLNTILCSTGQHREMLDQVMDLFGLKPDIDLGVMKPGQNLIDITCGVMQGLSEQFSLEKPDLVLVHGDTNTTLSASLACYYQQIPVHHVEAGLRTGNLYSPWPEEGNRKLTAGLASHHYAPTETAKYNLVSEGIDEKNITITGNTVIDALLDVVAILEKNPALEEKIIASLPTLEPNKKLILVTGHRRENFGQGFNNICRAIAKLATRKDVQIVYPVHLNPNVQDPVKRLLSDLDNVHLIETLGYLTFTHLMRKSYLILTDSGGVQEEAPTLGKPVLVMRDTTERPEAISAGTVKLVGTDSNKIVAEVTQLLENQDLYVSMSQSINPYGDGTACQKIMTEILNG